jgi:hypothetical protein
MGIDKLQVFVDAVASPQIVDEAERNLAGRLPAALPAFRMIVSRCLRLVPAPQAPDLAICAGLADVKDVPILAAAVGEQSDWLVTFNGHHFQPGHPDVTVLTPGQLILRVRDLLARLTPHEFSDCTSPWRRLWKAALHHRARAKAVP